MLKKKKARLKHSQAVIGTNRIHFGGGTSGLESSTTARVSVIPALKKVWKIKQ